MDEKTFHGKLDELMQEIATLPREQQVRLTEMAAQARDRQAKLKKTVNDLQESLDYLRLSIKYLVFDLEATRRENGYLRKMVEKSQASNPDGEHFGDDHHAGA